jgi:lysophospholipase L1-like esterase
MTEQLGGHQDPRRRAPSRRRVPVWAALVVIGLVTTGVGALSGGVASANRSHHVERGYLALGDSIAFGYSPLLEEPWVPQRFVGYPEIIGQQTRLTTTNLACPGQTAQALVSRQAVDAGCFEMRASARADGVPFLHTDYRGTQLRAALAAVRSDTPPSLISIQAGGNELSICFDDPHPKQCLDAALPKVTDSLREVAQQLRAAGYRGRVVLVGYHLVPGLEPQLQRMNRAIEKAARGPYVVFADTAPLFDHYAHRHHGDLCSAGLLVVLPDGSCDLHPTLIGQRLIADAVLVAAYGNTSHHGGV